MRDHGQKVVAAEDAVRRAVWTVKVPSMVMLLGPLGVLVLLMKLGVLPSDGVPAVMWSLPVFAVAFAGSWIIWSVQVPRWRRWAYRVVEDIPALKRLAVQRQIIWPEGHLFEKTEFASRALKEELRRLETGHRAL